MSSLLTQLKQVPINSGYFVAVVNTSSTVLLPDTTNTNIPVTGGAVTPSIGELYKDLGITVKVKGTETVTGTRAANGIYRKVVKVSELNTLTNPVEYFIRLDGNSCPFARMG